MNGFANAILSLLLGWLRSLLNAVWALLGSEGGGSLLVFLRENWKIVFLVLCAGGFVLDRVIYLIRWRPYYVWLSRRQNRASQDAGEASAEAPDYGDAYRNAYAPPPRYPGAGAEANPQPQTARYRRPEPEPEPDASPYAPASRFAPSAQDAAFAPASRFAPPAQDAAFAPTSRFAPPVPGAGYAPPYTVASNSPVYNDDRRAYMRHSDAVDLSDADPYAAAPPPDPARGGITAFSREASFAPTVSRTPTPYRIPLEPDPVADEPRFDEDLTCWEAPQNVFEDFAPHLTPDHNPAYGMTPAFGSSQPEPLAYLQDVQATYTPQPIPGQEYAPRSNEPVHPGLDLQTFQQNIGLTNSDELSEAVRRNPQEDFPNFTPFPVAPAPETSLTKPRGLGVLAKKARSFVSGDDERNPLSIHDLQPTVDVKNAFHEPVYPKKKAESEDE